jgi:DNA replication protein DnaC
MTITATDARRVCAKGMALTDAELARHRLDVLDGLEARDACSRGACGAQCGGLWTSLMRGTATGAVIVVATRCARRRDRERRARLEGRVARAGRPDGYTVRTLETFVPRPGTAAALRAIRHAIAGDRENLVLTGPPGAGKTHLAAALANARLAREEVRLLTTARLLETVRTLQRTGGDILAYQHDLATAALVVLDDLGAERPTPFSCEQIFLLLDDRLERGDQLQTVITTNLDSDALARHYGTEGARIVSRLLGVRWIALDASDYRQRGAVEARQRSA